MPIKIFVPRSVSCLAALLGVAFMASSASADQVIADDLIVKRDLCVGALACADGEIFGNEDIKVKSSEPEILFDDTSIAGGFTDWSLQTNANGSNSFVVRDQTNVTTPFRIEADTETNSLYVSSVGGEPRIGLGTALPQQELHIFSQNTAALRFEQGSAFLPPRVWDMGGNGTFFFLSDTTGGTIPFHVRAARRPARWLSTAMAISASAQARPRNGCTSVPTPSTPTPLHCSMPMAQALTRLSVCARTV